MRQTQELTWGFVMTVFEGVGLQSVVIVHRGVIWEQTLYERPTSPHNDTLKYLLFRTIFCSLVEQREGLNAGDW